MHRMRMPLRLVVAVVGVLLAVCVQPARAVTITALEDSFDSLDGTKFTLVPADFEAGSATINASANGQLTLTANGTSDFWGGATYRSVDTFASDKPTIITVDRVSQTGSGSAHRSALWLRQDQAGGTFMMLSQNIGENGWQTNANVTGTGANIARLDSLDSTGDSRKMSFAYIPFGVNNAAIVSMVDGFVVGSNTFNNWNNSVDFNVRVAALSRANGDTVSATFDNFSAKTIDNVVAPTFTLTDQAGTFPVSNTDLLQTSLGGTRILGNLGGQEGTSNNLGVLTNGTFGPAGLPDAAALAQTVAIGNDTSIIFDLDLAAAPLGYNITEIATYSGWRDGGRDDQDYIVLLSFIDDPSLFVPIANVDTSVGSGSSQVLVNANGDIIASGVAAVQFAFIGTENGFVGYREFDVIGTAIAIPEPASAMLGAMGLGLLALRRKRVA